MRFRLDQVESINTESPGNVCLLLHPFRPLIIAVDMVGVVRVYSARKPHTLKNAFYISSGKCFCTLLLIFQCHGSMQTYYLEDTSRGHVHLSLLHLWPASIPLSGIMAVAYNGSCKTYAEDTFHKQSSIHLPLRIHNPCGRPWSEGARIPDFPPPCSNSFCTAKTHSKSVSTQRPFLIRQEGFVAVKICSNAAKAFFSV